MRWLWLVALLASCDWVFRLDEVKFEPDPDVLPPGSGRWTHVAAGTSHTCALDTANNLFCWGRNVDGETGRATTDAILPTPGAVGTATWETVATSAATTCGIRGGALFCWGDNRLGQVGDNPTLGDPENDDRMIPTAIGSGTWVDVAIGDGHGCAIKDDHMVSCWGLNSAGEVGDNTTVSRGAPVPIKSATMFNAIAVGDNTTCGITKDNALYCWGDNDSAAYGMAGPSSLQPVLVAGQTWSDIALGNGFGCGITTDGALRCWGRNNVGQVGDGTQTNRTAPVAVLVPDGLRWVQVVANQRSACARSEDGRVFCWGDSTTGQLTVTDYVMTPAEIMGGPWTDMAIGSGHACFIGADYHMRCAGKNGFSQLADGGSSSNTPVLVPGGSKWREVTTGQGFTCAVDTDGNVKCAGRNVLGQLGTGTTTDAMTMTQTAGNLGNAVDLAAGIDHTCAQNGSDVYCWGGNYNFQLGLGDTDERTMPTLIRAGTAPSASMHSCALDSTLHMHCWGANEHLQINDSGQDVQSPFAVATAQTWSAVAAGRFHTCAIETTGAIWCLGDRNQVGVTDPGSNTDEMQFTGRVDMATIAAGSYHTCATTVSNEGWCWGSGYAGQLGLGDDARHQLPTKLTDAWTKFDAGEIHTCGIQVDKSLHCFGDNTFGQLGIPSGDHASSPALVSAMQWRTVAAAEYHTCAITEAEDLYCWGNNNDGALANGTAWRAELQDIP